MSKIIINNETEIEVSQIKSSGLDTIIISGFDQNLFTIDSLEIDTIVYQNEDGEELAKYNEYKQIQSMTFDNRCDKDLNLIRYYTVVLRNPSIASAVENIKSELVISQNKIIQAQDSMATDIDDIKKQIDTSVDIESLTLEEYKNYRQEENKAKLAEFLSGSTVLYKGEFYGVSQEDQDEMALQLISYQTIKAARDKMIAEIQAAIEADLITEDSPEAQITIEEPVLEWHSKKKSCQVFTETEFLELSYLVKSFVYPHFQKMQQIKENIFLCQSKEAITTIDINYEL